MATILILHGPNLISSANVNRGSTVTQLWMTSISASLSNAPQRATLLTLQSNAEHELIDQILTHRVQVSVSSFQSGGVHAHQRGASRYVAAQAFHLLKVHLSRVHSREPFRQHSIFGHRSRRDLWVGATRLRARIAGSADRFVVITCWGVHVWIFVKSKTHRVVGESTSRNWKSGRRVRPHQPPRQRCHVHRRRPRTCGSAVMTAAPAARPPGRRRC